VALAMRAGSAWITIVKFSHLILSTLTLGIIWRASILLLGSELAFLVLAYMCFDFPTIIFSALLMAETWFAFFVAILFFRLIKHLQPWSNLQASIFGLLFLLGFFLKGTDMVFPAVVLVWALFQWKSKHHKFMKPTLVFLGVITAGLLVHGGLTYLYDGTFRLTGDGGTVTFIEAFCDEKKIIDPSGYHSLSPLHAQLGEKAELHIGVSLHDSGGMAREALQCIKDHPLNLLKSIRYPYYFFQGNELWPANMGHFRFLERWNEIFFTFFIWPGLFIGFILAISNLNRPAGVWVLLPISAVLTCWVFKSELRFRVPFDGILVAMAILGWSWVASHLPAKRNLTFFNITLSLILVFGIFTTLALVLN
jgi:hypothetical protein